MPTCTAIAPASIASIASVAVAIPPLATSGIRRQRAMHLRDGAQGERLQCRPDNHAVGAAERASGRRGVDRERGG